MSAWPAPDIMTPNGEEPGIKARGVTSVEAIRRVHWDRWMRALHLYTRILLIALILGALDGVSGRGVG